jgi:hypothetical protein
MRKKRRSEESEAGSEERTRIPAYAHFQLPIFNFLFTHAFLPQPRTAQRAAPRHRELMRIADREFVPLPPERLLWKPAPGKWSVAQCLEHLNRYGLHYLPAMQIRIDDALARAVARNQPSAPAGWATSWCARCNPGTPAAPGRISNTRLPKAYDPNRTGTTPPKRCPRSCASNRPPSTCSKGPAA